VFAQPYERELVAKFPEYPYGILVRLLPPGTPVPPLLEVVRTNEDLYRSFQLDAQPGPDDELATAVHLRYAMTWKTLARRLEQAGDHVAAARATEYAEALGPAP
jgi:hypothetical protein